VLNEIERKRIKYALRAGKLGDKVGGTHGNDSRRDQEGDWEIRSGKERSNYHLRRVRASDKNRNLMDTHQEWTRGRSNDYSDSVSDTSYISGGRTKERDLLLAATQHGSKHKPTSPLIMKMMMIQDENSGHQESSQHPLREVMYPTDLNIRATCSRS